MSRVYQAEHFPDALRQQVPTPDCPTSFLAKIHKSLSLNAVYVGIQRGGVTFVNDTVR